MEICWSAETLFRPLKAASPILHSFGVQDALQEPRDVLRSTPTLRSVSSQPELILDMRPATISLEMRPAQAEEQSPFPKRLLRRRQMHEPQTMGKASVRPMPKVLIKYYGTYKGRATCRFTV